MKTIAMNHPVAGPGAVLMFCATVLLCAENTGEKTKGAGTLVVTSSAITAMDTIPSVYTCDGEDMSPPLSWSGVPETARSLVLIADDPDAPGGTWVHWVAYDIPTTVTGLERDIPATDTLPRGGRHGTNSWGNIGYGGPCPPSGTHRYFFKIYALDTMLALPAGKSKEEVLTAMEGHIIGQGELAGLYSRASVADGR